MAWAFRLSRCYLDLKFLLACWYSLKTLTPTCQFQGITLCTLLNFHLYLIGFHRAEHLGVTNLVLWIRYPNGLSQVPQWRRVFSAELEVLAKFGIKHLLVEDPAGFRVKTLPKT